MLKRAPSEASCSMRYSRLPARLIKHDDAKRDLNTALGELLAGAWRDEPKLDGFRGFCGERNGSRPVAEQKPQRLSPSMTRALGQAASLPCRSTTPISRNGRARQRGYGK